MPTLGLNLNIFSIPIVLPHSTFVGNVTSSVGHVTIW